MRNPFRSEEDAFRFLIAALPVAILAALLGVVVSGWAALAVFLLAAAVLAVVIRRAGPAEEPAWWVRRAAATGSVVVLTGEADVCPALVAVLAEATERARGGVRVLCTRTAPARHLDDCLETLAAAGIEALGAVSSDDDPVTAARHALASAAGDELIVVTLPESRSAWLDADVLTRARSELGVPVRHVVCDCAA